MQYTILLFLFLTNCTSLQNTSDISNQSLLKMADAALRSNDFQNAEALYQKILKNDPENLEALYKTGIVKKYEGNIQQALAVFDICINKDPKFFKAYLEKAYLYAQEKKYDQALDSYESILKADPKALAALNGKAMVLDIIGNHDQAQHIYKQILQLDPSYSYASNNMGLSYLFQGKWGAAIQIFEELNTLATTPRYRQNLALAYGLNGDFKKFEILSAQDLSPDTIENNLKFIQHLQAIYLQQGLLKNTDISLFPLLKDFPTQNIDTGISIPVAAVNEENDIKNISQSQAALSDPSEIVQVKTTLKDEKIDTQQSDIPTVITEKKLVALTPVSVQTVAQQDKQPVLLTKLSPSSLQDSSKASSQLIRLTPAD